MAISAKGDTKNVLVGAAHVFLSSAEVTDAGATPLAAPTLTTSNIEGEGAPTTPVWRKVGFTQEGVEVSYEPDYGEVEVDQLMDAARIFKQNMRVTVNTTFAEATLENLMVAWGQSEDSLNASELEIESGELGDSPVERAVAFVGPAPVAAGKQERVYTLNRAIQTESSSHALRRNESTGIPTSFRCLPNAAGSYGKVVDRAADVLA